MSELLRQELAKVESLRAVAKATGTNHASLLRFLRDDQSIRLDKADKLAEYFGIESRKRG